MCPSSSQHTCPQETQCSPRGRTRAKSGLHCPHGKSDSSLCARGHGEPPGSLVTASHDNRTLTQVTPSLGEGGTEPVASAEGLASFGVLCARPHRGPFAEILASWCGQSGPSHPHLLGRKPRCSELGTGRVHREWWGPRQPHIRVRALPSPAGRHPDRGHTVPWRVAPCRSAAMSPCLCSLLRGHDAAGLLRPLGVGSCCPDRTVRPVGPLGVASDLRRWLRAQ